MLSTMLFCCNNQLIRFLNSSKNVINFVKCVLPRCIRIICMLRKSTGLYVVSICNCGYWWYRTTLLVLFCQLLRDISVMITSFITGKMIAFTRHVFGRSFFNIFAVCCVVRLCVFDANKRTVQYSRTWSGRALGIAYTELC